MYQNKRITELNKRKNGQFSIVLMFRFVFEVKMITHSIKTIIAPVNPCIKFLSFFETVVIMIMGLRSLRESRALPSIHSYICSTRHGRSKTLTLSCTIFYAMFMQWSCNIMRYQFCSVTVGLSNLPACS